MTRQPELKLNREIVRQLTEVQLSRPRAGMELWGSLPGICYIPTCVQNGTCTTMPI